MSEQWKVGDKVRLTGRLWGETNTSRYWTGTEHEVTGVRADGWVQFKSYEYHWRIATGWEIELVERAEEKKMSIDISEVNVGDKVKLTRENGDEATFTVTRRTRHQISTVHNSYEVWDEDTLEILEKKFELVPGIYTHSERSDTVLVLPDGTAFFKRNGPGRCWRPTIYDNNRYEAHAAVREQGGWKRDITF